MPDLIAQGPQPRQRWRRQLPPVGRSAANAPAAGEDREPDGEADREPGGESDGGSRGDQAVDQSMRDAEASGAAITIGRGQAAWQVPWDDRISRQHVVLTPQRDGSLWVSKLAAARNPVFFRGLKQDSFRLQPGEHFVIGHTSFTLSVRPEVSDARRAADVTEHLFNVTELRGRHFRDAASRIEALGRLPDIIGGSTSDDELLVRVVSLLMQSIPSASAVAVIDAGDQSESPRMLHYDHRIADSQGPQPSSQLARQAVATRQSVLHLWGSDGSDAAADRVISDLTDDSTQRVSQGDTNDGGNARAARRGGGEFTASEGVDWAFCVPLPTESCAGWVIYVTGQWLAKLDRGHDHSPQAASDDLQDDVKFTELVGTTLGNLRQSRLLQQQQLSMQRFFAPVVMEALAGRDPEEVLRPRETDVSVIFCDLRGFSSQSEECRDQLLELLQRVSEALGVMTGEILRHGGVVGDFHGDAAMGFWGWPLDQDDAPGRAAEAALVIRDAFYGRGILAQLEPPVPAAARQGKRPGGRFGFRCGIGIATGRAVAGRIGTIDQVKVTAFGPVVNLASRLEGMTKVLGGDVLLDERTALWVRDHVSPDRARVRRLARVRPAGFSAAIDVYQLLRPAGTVDAPTPDDLIAYEAALDAMVAGEWEEAMECLHRVSATDRAKDFLTATILRHGRVPPANWDGVIDIGKQ